MNSPTLGILAAALALAAPLAADERPCLVLEKTIALPGVTGGFNHHSSDAQRHRLYLCATANKTVEVVDLETGTTVKSLPGEKPSATCYAPDVDLLCVSRGKSIDLYRGDTLEAAGSVPMPANVDEMHYDPRSGQLLAGSMTAPDEGIIPVDLAHRKRLPGLHSPKPQGFAYEEGGKRVFVCTPTAAQVSVLDRASGALAAWSLPDGQVDYSVASDATAHLLFVGCRRPAKLLVFNTDSGQIIDSPEIGKDTDDLSWDPANRRVYVACGEGVISVVERGSDGHWRLAQTVKTGPAGRNCGFIAETSEFYVTVPSHDASPASVLVYKASSASR